MKREIIMKQKQMEYIDRYNRANYKMYQFRVKKDSRLVEILDNKEKRNSYIVSLIENDNFNNILKLKDIKKTVKNICGKYGIEEIYLFGSYARGEATEESDVDLLCEQGNIKTYVDVGYFEDELCEALGKKVDVVFLSSDMNEYFYSNIREDMIKLC